MNPAENLTNRLLNGKWEVFEKIPKLQSNSGGYFSVCYKARFEQRVYFVKAYDFAAFFQMFSNSSQSGVDSMFVMKSMVDAYNFERDLSEHCKQGHVTMVSLVLDSGTEFIQELGGVFVPFLVFEMADTDVRRALAGSAYIDDAFKFKALHSIAKGLRQLHAVEVQHQDLKPSNVLLYPDQNFKICDLGRSVCPRVVAPHDNVPFSGDVNYAPPELVFGYTTLSKDVQKVATDLYMLGSMVVFLHSGMTINAMMQANSRDLFDMRSGSVSTTSLHDALEYTFTQCLNDVFASVSGKFFANQIIEIVSQLCQINPERRGHPFLTSMSGTARYSLERYLTNFDILYRKCISEKYITSYHG